MKRFLQLFGSYLRINVMNEAQYRVNFFVQLFQSLLAITTGLIGLALVFTYTDTLEGWNQSELLAVMGVYVLVGGLIQTFIQPNMERLMDDVRNGSLDYVLTKPADAQLLVSVREIRLWQLVDVIVGLVVLVVAVVQLRAGIGWQEALAFGAAVLLGGLMIYALWLIVSTTSFWFIRVDRILELLQSLYQAGRWPVGVYPPWLRLGLTFLVPVAFAVTVPAEALTGRLTPWTLLGALALASGLLVVSRLVWRWGLRSYTGASA